MWLLTAVGPVHGQLSFTFAIEQKKTYTLGREQGCDIRFESKKVRLKEGTLEVGDWDPTNRSKPPSLRYRVEAKKNKTYPPYSPIIVNDPANVGSRELDDYDITETTEGGGCFLHDNVGQGMWYAADAWFIVTWKDVSIVWDKLKDESDDTRENLKVYCISYSYTFDLDHHPNYVLSATYKANPECNYAVCYGIPIVLPLFLRVILDKISNCWKKVADSQDSFSFPDYEEGQYQPTLDPALPNVRRDVRCWLPDPTRRTLFEGWKIMGLKVRTAPAERRYLIAMGAQWSELDVSTRPFLSGQDFESRISKWLEQVDADGSREQAVVVSFPKVKEEIEKSGKDMATVVQATCLRLGVSAASGSILWSAVRFGGVRKYLEEAAINTKAVKEAAPVARRTRAHDADIPMTVVAEPIEKAALPASAELPMPERPPEAASASLPVQDVVPSTYPEETGSSKHTTVANTEVDNASAAAPDVPPPSQTGRKMLKRRAGRPLDLYKTEPIPETTEVTGTTSDENSQSNAGSFPRVEDRPATQLALSQSMDLDHLPSTQQPSQSQRASSSRLKRRAGVRQPIVDYSIPEDTVPQTQAVPAEIREVYEQAMLETGRRQLPKRPRLASVESSISRDISPTRASMDVDMGLGEGEDLDFVQQTLRDAAKEKKQGRAQPQGSMELMPPPAEITTTRRRNRSPTEETEQVEVDRQSRTISKAKAREVSPIKGRNGAKGGSESPVKGKKSTQTSADNEPTKDDAFLTAIAKNRKSKKAIDELDKEFNQLRIPKPGANPGSNVVKNSVWDASHPDYNLVNEFDDDLRGNFIEIIRVDLFRKDGGRKEAVVMDDGRPNFKKFKKKNIVRRNPVPMVLAGPAVNDPEMGEPYWPTQGLKKQGTSSQIPLTQPHDDEAEDEMPLLPRSRRRLLVDQGNHDGDDEPPSTAQSLRSRGARSVVPDASLAMQSGRVARKTRAGSAVSDVSSVGTSATSRPGYGYGRAAGSATVSAGVPASGTASAGGSRSATVSTGTGTGTTGRGRSSKAKPGAIDRDKEPPLIEESEEEVTMDLRPSGKSSRTAGRNAESTHGTGRGTTSRLGMMSSAAPTASGRIGDDEASTVGMARGKGGTGTQASTAAGGFGSGRRRLLVADDDDDDMVFKGLAKKRRLG